MENEFLYEALRQRCVYNEVYQSDPQGKIEQWFAYTDDFIENCMQDKDSFGEDCAIKTMKSNNINHENVERCLQDSMVRDRSGKIIDNKILKEDASWAKTLGIFMHPSISINNITYRGDMNGYDIFRAVCAGFQDIPQICKGDNVFELLAKYESLESGQSSNR